MKYLVIGLWFAALLECTAGIVFKDVQWVGCALMTFFMFTTITTRIK